MTQVSMDAAVAGRTRGMSRSVFALRFRETVGQRHEYLTRWRMLLAADRLKNSPDVFLPSRSRSATSPRAPLVRLPSRHGLLPRQYTRTATACALPQKRGAHDRAQELAVTG